MHGNSNIKLIFTRACAHTHTPTHPPIHKHARTCVCTHTYFSLSKLVHVIKWHHPLLELWWMKEQAWTTGGMIVTGENWSIWRKTFPTATLSSTNPTNTGLGQNPGLCSQRPPRLTYTKLNYHNVIMVTTSDCQLTCVKEEQSQQCVARHELTLRCNSPGSRTWHGSICSHDDFPP